MIPAVDPSVELRGMGPNVSCERLPGL
jgi:hypothetical protein